MGEEQDKCLVISLSECIAILDKQIGLLDRNTEESEYVCTKQADYY